MTQRTVNLYDGLEGLYYFESRYYDGTEIKDKSGYENHGEAAFTPTIGVNGRKNFDAASFNADSQFSIGIIIPDSSSWSVFGLIKTTNIDGLVGDGRNGGSFGDRGGSFSFRDNNNVEHGLGGYEKDEWCTVLVEKEDSTVSFEQKNLNGELIEAGSFTDTGNDLRLGARKIGNPCIQNGYIGKIAFLGIWHKILSDNVIEHLNDMTAPRRQLL